MTTPRIGRRSFLYGMAAASGAGLGACVRQAPSPPPAPTTRPPRPTTTTPAPPPTTRPAAARPTTAAAPTPPPSPGVQLIGEQYLTRYPSTTPGALEAMLPYGVDRAASTDAQLTQATDVIAADFGKGRTERLDGWWFSRTEARICALGVLRAG